MKKSAGAGAYTLKNIIAHEKRLFQSIFFMLL